MWTTKKIAEALGQKTSEDLSIQNFHFDSRQILPGDCFLALPGTTVDGHNFIDDARARGAICVIGQRNSNFLVQDTYQSLNQLAHYAKKHSGAKRIAITGSVGKTTTTAFLAQILQKQQATICPQNSFNNHIGVPLTMTKLSPSTKFGLFEIGTNHPGEIRPLADLVNPHIAVITKIGVAHIGHFRDQRAIAEEKAQLLYALTDDGIGIVPDDEFLSIYQGVGKQLIVVPPSHEAFPTLPPRLHANVVLAKKTAELLGVNDFDPTQLSVPQGRGTLYTQRINGRMVTLIDDAYNASFDAFIASLDDFSYRKGRKILVVGDLGEVGDLAASYHTYIADKIDALDDVAQVFSVGPQMSAALKQSQCSLDQVSERLSSVVRDGDTILFKGAKVSGVSKIVEQLMPHS